MKDKETKGVRLKNVEIETLFFGLFDSSVKRHDRMELFHSKERKTLQDLFNWLEEKRNTIESNEGRKVLIVDFKILNNG